jgi:hypothetical protein
MKHVLFLLFFLTLFIAPACKKDNDGSDSTFSCEVDGQNFDVKGLGTYATNFSNYFTIYGIEDWENNSSANLIYMSLPLGSNPGTYNLDNSDRNGYYIDANGMTHSTLWGVNTGKLVIDEIDDKHVKGTFEFTSHDAETGNKKKTITNGRFDVLFR